MGTIALLSASDVTTHLDGLVALLQDAVESGGAVSFIAPVARDVAEAFWQNVARQIDNGTLHLLVAQEGDRVAGSVQLALATQVNAPHRAEIQKLLVHRDFRRRGLAMTLMQTIEEKARQTGRSLLVLDTRQDGGAGALYEKLGYTRAGVIPDYAVNNDGTLHATVIYYKKVLYQ